MSHPLHTRPFADMQALAGPYRMPGDHGLHPRRFREGLAGLPPHRGRTGGDLDGDVSSPDIVLHANLRDGASNVEESRLGQSTRSPPRRSSPQWRRSPPLPSKALIRTMVAPGSPPIVPFAAEDTLEPPARRTR